jgi:hypothetical protein
MDRLLRLRSCSLAALTAAAMLLLAVEGSAQPNTAYKVHDWNRPRPPIIEPGRPSTQEAAGKAPSDATVLFDGTDLSKWAAADGSPSKWVVRDGVMECTPGSGPIRTLQNFGDCQLHIEFATPVPPKGRSQGRGNSGVYLMGTYEIQVLDSYQSETYADGQASAVYGQYPPLVNAALPPGQWQSYDIVFTRPRFDESGQVVSPARVTVLHNGVLTQNNVTLSGPTDWMNRLPYRPHADKLPLSLQDHGNPVRYRNVWMRELGERGIPEFTYSKGLLDKYAGTYRLDGAAAIVISRKGEQLFMKHTDPSRERDYALLAVSGTKFNLKTVDASVEFRLDSAGAVSGLTLTVSGDPREAKRVP